MVVLNPHKNSIKRTLRFSRSPGRTVLASRCTGNVTSKSPRVAFSFGFFPYNVDRVDYIIVRGEAIIFLTKRWYP